MSIGLLDVRLTRSASRDHRQAGRAVVLLVLTLAAVAALGGVFGGPTLGDHEAIVAECARGMRQSGDWLVPRFLDTPFIRKPPLPYWLVAAVSYLFPNDPATGLPVTAAAARLPSALAGLGTILLLWRMGSMMFGRLGGIIAAVVASSSVFVLLFSPNATVEMILTFCCTWAGLHFWCGVTSSSAKRRFGHMMLFYFAMGVGMLAKGPAPLALVGVPLALWCYTYRAQRGLARGRLHYVGIAGRILLRDLGRQTWRAFTRLWLIPGLIVFGLLFVPWTIAVAHRLSFAWDLWNWQYLQRFQGDYGDTRVRTVFYYVPVAIGLLAPWCVALIEGLMAPWLPRYRRQRKALYFVGVWAVVGTLVMSLMEFKKPYYILPALPGLVLLVTPVLERFITHVRSLPKSLVHTRTVAMVVAIASVGVLLCWYAVWHKDPVAIAGCGGLAGAGLLFAMSLYARGRSLAAVMATAVVVTLAFVVGWQVIGPRVDKFERVTALDEKLNEVGVPRDVSLYFADQRPDARVSFYCNRRIRHLIAPADIVRKSVVRERGDLWLQFMAIDKAQELLSSPGPVYLLLDRKHLLFIDQMPPELQERVHVLVSVRTSEDSTRADDWVVVTNRAA